MINNTVQKIINESSYEEIKEIIKFCQNILSRKFDMKDILRSKFEDPRYVNCSMIMLGGIYNFVDDKEIWDFDFTDVNEYERMLYEVYEKSSNNYKRSYASFDVFEKADLYMQILFKEGENIAVSFMKMIKESKGWPVTHAELEHSDGGFDVLWIYNKNTNEIYIDDIDNCH